MSKVIWIPGVGNTETFDDAIIPPGGYLVSPPSNPAPVSSIPVATPNPVIVPASAGSGGYSGGGGSSGFIPVMTYNQAGGTAEPAIDPIVARAQQKANNKAWSNDPATRQIEEQSWDIYVQTGRWDTPEQIALHQQAEAMRKAQNPTYGGSGPAGPITQGDENKIVLPPPTGDALAGAIGNTNNIVTLGLLAVGAIVVGSFFKG